MRGQRLTIDNFLAKARDTSDTTVTVIPEGERSPVAERCHRNGSCFVLSEATLGRFGVESVQALVDGVTEAINRDLLKRYGHSYWRGDGNGLKCVENWRDA